MSVFCCFWFRKRAKLCLVVCTKALFTAARRLCLAMILLQFVCALFYLNLSLRARASALTTAIAANERLCFYADVDKAGEKIGVRINIFSVSLTL
jgi:hypothetical protein